MFMKASAYLLTALMLSVTVLAMVGCDSNNGAISSLADNGYGASNTRTTTAPSAPRNLTATAGNSVVHLTWNRSANEGGDGVLVWCPCTTGVDLSRMVMDENYLYMTINLNKNDGAGNFIENRIEKRYKSNGTLVGGFGTGGFISENPNVGDNDYLNGIAVDNTSIYLCGGTNTSTYSEWRIEKRYKSNGTLDKAFDFDGIINNWVAGYQEAAADIKVDSKYIYIGGYDTANNPWDYEWRLEKRWKTNGSFATSFASGGVYKWNRYAAGGDFLNTLVIDDNWIYAGGCKDKNSPVSWAFHKINITSGVAAYVLEQGWYHDIPCVSVDNYNIYISGDYSTTGSGGRGDNWRLEKNTIATGAYVTGFGTSGSIVGPGGNKWNNEILVNGTDLYVVGEPWKIDRRDNTTGSIKTNVSMWPVPGGGASANTFCYDGKYLYVAGWDTYTSYSELRIEKRHNDTLALDPNFGASISNYRIYRGTVSGGETLLATVGQNFTYNDTTVTNGVKYYYKVVAMNGLGEGALSNEVFAQPCTIPTAPISLGAIGNVGAVNLTWFQPTSNGGSNITNFTIYRGLTSGTKTLLTTIGNVTMYNDTAVSPGTTYYYVVRAKNSAGSGPNSTEASAATKDFPSAPLTPGAVAGNANVTLTWAAPASNGGAAIKNYTVLRGTSSGAGTPLTTLGNVLTYLDLGLTNGQKYFYTVKAKNAVGFGPNSLEVNATPMTVPSTPLSFKAVAGNTNVTLNWTAPASSGGSPISNYTVYRGTTSGSGTPLVTLGNVLAYLDLGLTNGQKYYYTVKAKNAVGFGPNSTEANATPRTIPTAPRGLTAVAGNTNVTLNWTAPTSNGGSQITNYTLYRGTTAGAGTLLTTLGNVLTYKDLGLTNGQKYYYTVKAKNAVGLGPSSAEVNATPVLVVVTTVPTAPLGLTALAGDANVTLNWTAPASNGSSPILNYTIYRGTTAGTGTVLVTLGNVLTYLDTGLTNGQAYFYTVKAKNAVGFGPNSTEANATPAGTPITTTVPTAPLNLTAVAGDAEVTLDWLAPVSDGGSAILNYTIYRGDDAGTEIMLIELGNVLTYTDTGLTNGQTYYYLVRASNAIGMGPGSTEANATPEAVVVMTVPSAPLDLTATAANGEITLEWLAPTSDGGSPILNYTIYRGSTAGTRTLLETIDNSLIYTDSGLTNGQTYYYTVSAKNAAGSGPNSTEASATPATVTTAPTQAQNVVVTPGESSITITWGAPFDDGGSAITGYLIYRSTSPGGETLLTEVGNVLTYTDTAVTPGTKYYYKVVAKNAAGNGTASNEVSVTVPPIVKDEPKDKSWVEDNWWIFLLLLLAVIVLIIIVVIVQKRKKEDEDEEGEEGAEEEGAEDEEGEEEDEEKEAAEEEGAEDEEKDEAEDEAAEDEEEEGAKDEEASEDEGVKEEEDAEDAKEGEEADEGSKEDTDAEKDAATEDEKDSDDGTDEADEEDAEDDEADEEDADGKEDSDEEEDADEE